MKVVRFRLLDGRDLDVKCENAVSVEEVPPPVKYDLALIEKALRQMSGDSE